MKPDMKKFREVLEQNTPEVIECVSEWLQTLLAKAEKPDKVECPKCGREFLI